PEMLPEIQHFDRYRNHRLFFDFEDYYRRKAPGATSDLTTLLENIVVYKAATPRFIPSQLGFEINNHSGLTTYVPQARFPNLNDRYGGFAWAAAVEEIMHTFINMFSSILTEYVHSISRTRKGLRILIVDNLFIQQLAFLEMAKQYLPESKAQAVDRVELEEQLNGESEYDLVIVDEWFLFQEPKVRYISRVRRKFPGATIALF